MLRDEFARVLTHENGDPSIGIATFEKRQHRQREYDISDSIDADKKDIFNVVVQNGAADENRQTSLANIFKFNIRQTRVRRKVTRWRSKPGELF
jgi:hypothetical protein